MKPTQGFATIVVISFIALLVGVLGIIAYFKFSSKQSTVPLPIPVSRQSSAITLPTLSPASSPMDETANWKTYKSTSCPVVISYPQSWNITDLKLAKGVDYTGNSLGCFKITSPEYVTKLGEEAGGRINISKLAFSNVISDSKINNFDDYIAVLKKQTTVTGLQDKQFDPIIGKRYLTSGFFAETNFAFVKNNSLYIISWNNDSLSDSEKKLIDQILSSFKFL